MNKIFKLFILILCLTAFGCNGGSGDSNSNDNGDKFVGQWQSQKSEDRIYTITKVNNNTYLVEWNGYNRYGQLHTGGSMTTVFNNGNLETMNTTVVVLISDNEILVKDEHCLKK